MSGETSQTLGEIRIGNPIANLKISNDVDGLGDGGDRIRSAAGQFNVGPFSLGFNVGTGDPGLKSEDRFAPFGTYLLNRKGDDPDKYRLGIGYLGVGPVKLGVNSEKLRAGIQNNFHDLIGSPHFKVIQDFKDRQYLELKFGGSTIWD